MYDDIEDEYEAQQFQRRQETLQEMRAQQRQQDELDEELQ